MFNFLKRKGTNTVSKTPTPADIPIPLEYVHCNCPICGRDTMGETVVFMNNGRVAKEYCVGHSMSEIKSHFYSHYGEQWS